jgi:F-type H+-transporting ATPase subunit delta
LIKDAVARRYAKGLFDVACEMNIVEEVAQDLDKVAALLEQEPDLQEVLEYRRVPTRVKKEIIRNLMQDSISPVALGFLEILIDKHREQNFSAICESYRDFLRRHKNIVVAAVKTAYPLLPLQAPPLSLWLSPHFPILYAQGCAPQYQSVQVHPH